MGTDVFAVVIRPKGVLNHKFPRLVEQSRLVWSFVRDRLDLKEETAAPRIYFYPFEKEKQSVEFSGWQREWLLKNHSVWQDWVLIKNKQHIEITDEWIQQNIDQFFPFPKTFLAFHYDNTSYIQMNPKRTMLSSYQNDPYGVPRDFLGVGFYIMGHEMFHYGLQEKRILPGRIHHCLFVKPTASTDKSLMEELADFLIEHGLSSSSLRFFGPESEKKFDPCQKLDAKELLETTNFLKEI